MPSLEEIMQDADIVHIALDPAIGVGPAAFVRAWNADEATKKNGEAQVSSPVAMEALIDPALMDIIITVASGVSAGVLTEAVMTLIRKRFRKSKVPIVIEIVTELGEKVLKVKLKD